MAQLLEYYYEFDEIPEMQDVYMLKKGFIIFPLATVLYLSMVYWLPKFMKNKEPFQIKNFVIVYNTFMVIVNTGFVLFFMWKTNFMTMVLTIRKTRDVIDPDLIRIGFILAPYAMATRFLDYLDTLWIILRKKNYQLSFLHVFHHAIVPIGGYVGAIFAWKYPICTLVLPVNFTVHAFMFSYYTFRALRYSFAEKMKIYITRLQIVQLLVGVTIGTFFFLNEEFDAPKYIQAIFLALGYFFLFLFLSFYMRTYKVKKA